MCSALSSITSSVQALKLDSSASSTLVRLPTYTSVILKYLPNAFLINSLNVVFCGRLVRDFEKREKPDGQLMLTNSLAIKKSQDKTTFIDIAIFTTKLCEIAEKYLKKGDYCVYECELTTYDKDEKRYVSAVVKNIIFTQNNKKKEG
jgi:hypothetical protein